MSTRSQRDESLLRAEWHANHGKLATAILEYQRLLEEAPEDLWMLNMLGDLYVRAGRRREAAGCFRRLGRAYADANAPEKAIAVFKKLARIDGDKPDVMFSLAKFSIALGRKVDAHGYYRQGCSLKGTLISTQEGALEVLKGICELDLSDATLWMELARNYATSGRLFSAYEAYTTAGRELLSRGERERGLVAYQEALDLNPNSRSSLSAVAEILVDYGNVEEAVTLVRRALKENPHDVDLIVILGRTWRKAGRLDEAEEVFTRLSEIDPPRSQYLFEVAARFAEAGETERALAIIDRQIDRVIDTRSRSHVITLLEEMVASNMESDAVFERLASIYERIGDSANAERTLAGLERRRQARENELWALIGQDEEVPDPPTEVAAPTPRPSTPSVHDKDAQAAIACCLEAARQCHEVGDANLTKDFLYEAFVLGAKALAEQSGPSGPSGPSFEAILDTEWRRAARHEQPLSLIRVRVDDASAAADDDALLERVGSAISAALNRPGDVSVRRGRHEFAVILPETSEDGAQTVVIRIRRQIAGLKVARRRGVALLTKAVQITFACAMASPSFGPESLAEEVGLG